MEDVVQVRASADAVAVIKNDGTLWYWNADISIDDIGMLSKGVKEIIFAGPDGLMALTLNDEL